MHSNHTCVEHPYGDVAVPERVLTHFFFTDRCFMFAEEKPHINIGSHHPHPSLQDCHSCSIMASECKVVASLGGKETRL